MIPIEQPWRKIFSRTSSGLVRLKNEDRFGFSFFRASETDPTPILLAVVADGVGGQKAGEIAANIAVETIQKSFQYFEAKELLKALEQSILEANREIVRQAETSTDTAGMACTCAAAVMVANRLFIANVGDSRIYIMQKGRLTQISRDHTLGTEFRFLEGVDEQDQVKTSSRSHIITRYLGSDLPPKVDLGLYLDEQENLTFAIGNQGLELGEHDLVLICSDGLTDMVLDGEIEATLKSYPANQVVASLTDAALKRGGEDNITLIVIDGPVSK